MVFLGVDWGRARTGVAVSDELGLFAHPVEQFAVASDDDFLSALRRIAADRHAEGVVLGLPLNMDGTEGDSSAEVRRLASKVEKQLGLRVVLWDERLTTWEAERFLTEERGLSAQKKKKVRDQMAACLILQNFLDSRKK